MRSFLRYFRRLHVWLLVNLALIAAFFFCSGRSDWMTLLAERVSMPIERALGRLWSAAPFSVAELLARVRALLRRASSVAEETSLRVEDLELDTRSRKVFRSGVRIDLQPLEYQLLEYLMRNRGRVVSRTTIMQHVWEYDFDTGTNIVESRMCRLREKVDKPFGRKLIRTVRGFGYVLD